MFNMGGQGLDGVTYARELKKTANSISSLFLTRQDSLEEHLLACRVGDTFYFYTWNEDAESWQQETFYNNVEVGGNMVTTGAPVGFSVVSEFSEPASGASTPMYFQLDLPDTIQVGVISHAWSAPYETQAEYDYVNFSASAPQNQADCLTAFANPE